MNNYDMAAAPGRTYRYYTGTPLFPFGFGLSYTKFSHTCTQTDRLKFSCIISNVGSVDGDEVIMVFHSVTDPIRKAAPHPIPLKSLVQFQRVTISAGAQQTVPFSLPPVVLRVVDENGDKVFYNGTHNLIFSRGDAASDVIFQVDVELDRTGQPVWLSQDEQQALLSSQPSGKKL